MGEPKVPEWHEHNLTDEIVCPYCGEEHDDSWEIDSNSGEFQCQECGKEFFFERDTTVVYSTSPKDPDHA